jgi:ligand-binding sensor domain-containing protein
MKRTLPLAVLALLMLLKIYSAFSQQVIFNKVSPPGNFRGDLGGITQDKNGYLWIGTHDGLYRYDGYNFSLFTHDPNRNSLSHNYVETVYADREGMIWIGTWGEGLDRLDPVTGIFTHFGHKSNDPGSLSNDSVRAVLEDRDGVLWVGSNGGLDRYDPKTGKFKNYHYDPNDPFSLSWNRVRIVYEDREGTLWVGTGDVWDTAAPPNAGGLNRFDKRKGKFIRYQHEPNNPHSLIDNKVRAIYEDSRGVFWVGTAGDGLHTMDRKTGTFERHQYDPANPEKLSRPALAKSMTVDHISFITEDVLGNIWIGTLGNGLNRYDPKTQKIVHYGDKDSSAGFTNKTVWCSCISKDGVLWIGTSFRSTLYKIDPYSRNIPHVYTGSRVNAFEKDFANGLWIGTDQGLILRNISTGYSKKFVHETFNQTSLSNDGVQSICRDHEGTLWVGTSNGLNRLNALTNTFTRFQYNLKDRDAGLITIIEDAGGDSLWLGTGNGLELMNKRTGSVTHFRNDPKDTNSLRGRIITSLLSDSSGNLWIGTAVIPNPSDQWGLDYFDQKAGIFRHLLKNIGIYALFRDSDGTLWLGTSEGLYKTISPAKGFVKFADSHTGVEAGNGIESTKVFSIWEDNKKNIWVNTPYGIYKISLRNNQSTFFGADYGVKDFYHYRLYRGLKGIRDEIYFADEDGYYDLLPGQLNTNPTPPLVIFSGFRVRGRPAASREWGPLTPSLDSVRRITLKHDQNSFSFDFASIHYSNPGRNRLFYKLENYDQDWLNAGVARTAYYYNVPPGSYIFKVKGASSEGVWAERAIEVTVMPPWWNTWWAYFMYAVLITVAIWAIVHFHSRSLRRELEQRKKDQQLAELQHQKSELEMRALRAQMNPHFIFNSLNSIDLFILQNDKAKASKYLTKFSRLIRMILDSSTKATVSLAEDLEALQLYLDLERLRCDQKFSFRIKCDPDIDADFIQLPPMLLQPFAENAIWHGLMNLPGRQAGKKEGGHLCISINQEDSTLICTIMDDGIGRKKAAELEDKSGKHKSMGMKITEGRIAMMPEINGENKSVEIRDLVDADGNAAGTEVVLRIPV